ncbi:MAG: aminotransferase class V-fold PLP-dependent enzyme [Hyphomicrobiaceae bacterium]|nr:aminotransferase class V-fold PLP-dependent enzyme [Hyphomicrobiaceae bacterium]
MKLEHAFEAENTEPHAQDSLEKLNRQAVGLDVRFKLATGETTRRIYLDSTASTLRLQIVQDVIDKYQPYYANTHSVVHFGAKLSTCEYAWAHDMVLRFLRADPDAYTAFFTGHGTTAGINRVAQTLRAQRPDRDVVITSVMEHHSNDLPHRKHFAKVVHVPAEAGSTSMGRINLAGLEAALREHGDRVNYVSITGVSNVTGIINPVHEIAELAHRFGTLLVVDGAQMAAHVPVRMSGHDKSDRDIDVFVFSGHKIYAPGSPGVVVARKDLFSGLEPQEVGGGMVDDVWLDRYTPTDTLPDREEAGTPNICGSLGLAAALYALDRVGMDTIFREECALMRHALGRLGETDDIVVYGDTDVDHCQRAGAISFNVRGVHHALTGAVLNDYFNIAVRNECFCAHPYVREMISEVLADELDGLSNDELEELAELQRGMVRASFGIYTTRGDIDALVEALRNISANRDYYAGLYEQNERGDFVHKTFNFDHAQLFSVRGEVDAWLAA